MGKSDQPLLLFIPELERAGPQAFAKPDDRRLLKQRRVFVAILQVIFRENRGEGGEIV
jgi:hypothetical protein